MKPAKSKSRERKAGAAREGVGEEHFVAASSLSGEEEEKEAAAEGSSEVRACSAWRKRR